MRLRGSFSLTGKTGKHVFRFRGRIGDRTFTPGSYRLVGTPFIAGIRGKPTTHSFSIIR